MVKQDDLYAQARHLAEKYGPTKYSKLKKAGFPSIEGDARDLFLAYKKVDEQVKAKQNIIPAAEWILDNFYMLEEQSKHIQLERLDNFGELPTLEGGKLRIYALAEDFVSFTDGKLGEEEIISFLEGYQSITPLDSGELWIFPMAIKIALIRKTREVAVHIVKLQEQKKDGQRWGTLFVDSIDAPKGEMHKLIVNHDSQIDYMPASYVEGMLLVFRNSGEKSAHLMTWLDGKLALQGTNAEEMIQLEHQKQAGYQVSIGNCITSLRFLLSIRWEEIFEELSLLEEILNNDPAKFYSEMEFVSRDYYRNELIKIARKYKVSEFEVAEAAIRCAEEGISSSGKDIKKGHIGYYLIGRGRGKLRAYLGDDPGGNGWINENPGVFYFGSIGLIVLTTLGFMMGFLYKLDTGQNIFKVILSGLVLLVPVITLAVGFMHKIIPRVVRPYYLPKLELRHGIPEEYRTMVVIPTLLTEEKRVWELAEQMEVFYLANQEDNIHFALISDFKDSKNEEEPGDGAIIEAATRAVNELNNRYGRNGESIFYFFHRHRKWDPKQMSWMGWERKRGALVEFTSMLRGDEDTSFSTKIGDLSILPKIKYVITLDADTNLPRDAAKRLIGTLAHPLNRPVIDSSRGFVTEGYGLLQPRIGVSVDSASRSSFALTFSGQTGVDPYTTAVSDVYQDLFSEGIFTGKGIYDADVFNMVLKEAIPENRVLSHDLLEGSYIRAGLVTDIELIDGYPANYISYAMRLHRWVRGDWQLLPWLFPKVYNRKGIKVKNPLRPISKWKIFDNLRRSLVYPSLFLMLALGLTVLPRSDWFWLGLFAITLTLPLIMDVAGSFIAQMGSSHGQSLGDVLYGTKHLAMQIILTFVFLAHQAYILVDAIVRTLVRVLFTGRNMLEWVTAADTDRKFKGGLEDYWRKMLPAMVISVAFFIWVAVFRRSILIIPLAISLVWLISPLVAYKTSQPKDKKVPELSKDQIDKLRMIGRKTWKYFDELLTEEDNWLPPDNFQEEPNVGLAPRTSPTNIGLALVSILSARDFGYIGTSQALERFERTIDTLKALEKWNGHFYNWYDIRTLEPLKPEYVSSVDSGNLACYLILLKQGINELIIRPLVSREMAMGIKDTIRLDFEKKGKSIPSIINMLEASQDITLTDWGLTLNQLGTIGEATDKQIGFFRQEMAEIVPWVNLLLETPKCILGENGLSDEVREKYNELMDKLNKDFSLKKILDEYYEILDNLSKLMLAFRRTGAPEKQHREVAGWLKQLEIALSESYTAARKITIRCKKVIRKIDEIFNGMDFAPLYDNKKELFSIGYDVSADKLDDVYYDLLASEARQASFVAIAKGDIPQKHWFKLARSLTLVGDSRSLLSWGGTMFEYLMPHLIMKNYKNTLWDETYRTVLKGQRQYGDQRHVPWGVSESAFYAFDLQLNYQYKAFGVPKLGLKKGLLKDIVITPYASIMGLTIDPLASMKNIEQLLGEGMGDGKYGLYESMDYTPERVPSKVKHMIVKTYMAHHQGMIFLAINNYLNGDIMQERFHSVPMIRATELLLQEKIPQREVFIKDYNADTEVMNIDLEKKTFHEVRTRRIFETANTEIPQVSVLSNNFYSAIITNSGGGFSQYNGLAINRWREDVTKDNRGMFFYIKNLNSGEYWSSAYQPCLKEGDRYEVTFDADKAIFSRQDGNIETKTEVVVSPEHNVEIRKISLHNHSDHKRIMEVTSYFEPILIPQEDDSAHPAFSNLFVETEYIHEHDILIVTRRPRDENQKPLWLANALVVDGEAIGATQYETDRYKFIGRGRALDSPKAMDADQPLLNSTGSVLDPVMSLRCRVGINSGEEETISYIVAIAESKDAAINLAREYKNTAVISRAFELAWTHAQVEMRYLNITTSELNLYQQMLSSIIFTNPARGETLGSVENYRGQEELWTHGVSGDLPIVTVKVDELDQLETVKQMLSIHEYWRLKGVFTDLIILNEYGNSYEQPVQDRIQEMLTISHLRELQDRSGGVFLLAGSSMTEEDKTLIRYGSKLFIDGKSGSVASQIEKLKTAWQIPDTKVFPVGPKKLAYKARVRPELLYYNDIGGFSEDGREYIIYLTKSTATPLPWSNIVSNDGFGFLVTESGGGYTWQGNSRENKLTPWSNDPVVDPIGEAIYLRDEETGEVWSITPSPIRTDGEYEIRHGQGYSVFEYNRGPLKQRQTMFVNIDKPIKYYYIELDNTSEKARKLSLTFYVEWICGVSPNPGNMFIVTEKDKGHNALLARNPYNKQFGEQIAFIATDREYAGVTGDRLEFLGRNGELQNPAAMKRVGLSGRVGSGLDPCGAIQIHVEIPPGKQEQILFTLGQGENRDHVKELIEGSADIMVARETLEESKTHWDKILGIIQVETPDKSMDLLLNRWLIYQTLACRILARTGFYQAGGAYGFRDQLQDVLALVYSKPERMKEQILLSSWHQFIEGDVQHWWHPPNRGVRTRITDDLLFLPFVTANYIEGTGDLGILEEETHFLMDEPLEEGEDDRYNSPDISEYKESIYEHCIRAIDKSLNFGRHGLPLIGTGDWNDGMNRVGAEGEGESVWLGWFLYTVLNTFIGICRKRNDEERAEKYSMVAGNLRKAIEEHGWDGGWYRRAYFDDGTPLGSEQNEECRIDAISQSWSVISGAADPTRAKIAMESMEKQLVRKEDGLIQLLTPPFHNSTLEPGYIKGYGPGLRENGGQYTHGVTWTILANAILGYGQKAWELFHMINPINHSRTWIEINKYKGEPYVMAADVYSVDPHVGRAGWTWYTGSSSWMYRIAMEWILGLKLRGDKLYIDPCIPPSWEGFVISYRHKDAAYKIKVENPDKISRGLKEIWADGTKSEEKYITLSDGHGRHEIKVIMGKV